MSPVPPEKRDKEEKKKKKVQLSAADEKLKSNLDSLVGKVEEASTPAVVTESLTQLKDSITSSTSSMTSIPKPLKFLNPHYETLSEAYKAQTSLGAAAKSTFSSILSLLSMLQPDDELPVLEYALKVTKNELVFRTYGHEYTVQLQSQIVSWYKKNVKEAENPTDEHKKLFDGQIWPLAQESIKYLLDQNSIVETIDLVVELEKSDCLTEIIPVQDVHRATLYMINLALINPELGDILYRLSYDMFMKHKQYANALRIAMKMDNNDMVVQILSDVDNAKEGRLLLQLAHMMGRQHFMFDLDQADDFEAVDGEKFINAAGNVELHTFFRILLRDLDLMEPKLPQDVYKTTDESTAISAKQNLAKVFVNGFLNCGAGKDKLLAEKEGAFIWQNKDHGIMCAVASLGLLHLWDMDNGLSELDKFLQGDDIKAKAGALLGVGVVCSNIRDDNDSAWAFLEEPSKKDGLLGKAASLGIGIAYASTAKEDAEETLGAESISESEQKFRALAQGLIYAGCMTDDLMNDVISWLVERDEATPLEFIKKPENILPCIAFGLSCLGTKKNSETALMLINEIPSLPKHIKDIIVHLVKACAYSGTGDVLVINEFLEYISSKSKEEFDRKKKEKEEAKEREDGADEKDQKENKEDDEEKEKEGENVKDEDLGKMIAVIGIAMVAMGEDISQTMATRMFSMLFRYGDKAVRRAAPLGLALLHMSNPDLTVTETLSKFTHDQDSVVAQMSILGLGFAGAGTNNARLASSLRQLAEYYKKDPKQLFCVRFAQGILHLGKGCLTMNPFHSDGLLMHKSALSGLLVTMFCLCLGEKFLQGDTCWVLYTLALAFQPRMLVTIAEPEGEGAAKDDEDAELKNINVDVRVGTAVDTVAMAGKPMTITGFQTHKTPVIIAVDERAVLAGDDYEPLTDILEGVVILQKKPADQEDEKEEAK